MMDRPDRKDTARTGSNQQKLDTAIRELRELVGRKLAERTKGRWGVSLFTDAAGRITSVRVTEENCCD